MIVDVPDSSFYLKRSENLLHLAASMCIELVNNSQGYGHDHDEEILAEYWDKCQPALSNALTLVQQAQELGLKGLIATTSPFLLISRDPRDWPRGCDQKDVPFSAFRTADAADLPKLHDTVCRDRLNEDQKKLFEEVRGHRNLIVHHGSDQPLTVDDLILIILQTFRWLHKDQTWFGSRDHYLSNDQLATLYSNDHVAAKLVYEFETIKAALDPKAFQSVFSVNKKQRWYFCPSCRHEMRDHNDPDIKPAQLNPNSPQSTNIFCVVCEKSYKVARMECTDPECKGNVISDESDWYAECLTCGQDCKSQVATDHINSRPGV